MGGLLDSICILERSSSRKTHWEGQIAGKRPVSDFLLVRNEGTLTSGCGRGGGLQVCELLGLRKQWDVRSALKSRTSGVFQGVLLGEHGGGGATRCG